MAEVLLTVGTRKGLFIGRRRDGRWKLDGPFFNAQAIYSTAIDTRSGVPRLLAGGDSTHFGPSVFHSDDLGRTWTEPKRPAVKFPKDTDSSLERVWQLHPAGPAAPGVVYAGTEPAALFKSEDGGETFELVRPLWEHPTRSQWVPGGGGEGLHTVVTDARDAEALTVAVSTAGVFRSTDGGASWHPSNTGVSAVFLPEDAPEFGQCVHKIAQSPGDQDRLYLQNHWGVYRSDDGGARWQDIGGGLPSDFGFAAAAHPHRTDTAYVFPITADSDRVPAGHRCRVFRTSDAGASWEALSAGLPEGAHYGTVLRDALCTDGEDPAGVYFGNRNGELYASADDGESWQQIASHLPDVLCVRAAAIG
ncbi:WD40/YVTN/BNR-like repeat-containing protein [Streptomyces tsukubensis]|uniref:Glycosyl hydrolase n=1 Tax=Streptomyces tsukubensis TaxID=83656 RepID=A0A1V4A030_9ACTN|nr:sialidase family protein [Streptomyces tsukubensis]OON71807.1 glycosyl hydrolase [Streptomyces tsukubensis]QFR97008.1 exo-alpha-sialidase [Streptomyces tsukubensis]